MNGSTLGYAGSGSVICTTATPTTAGPNAIGYDAAGRLCIGPAVAPVIHVAGLPYGRNGRICIDYALPVRYVAGIGITSSGTIACVLGGIIARYVRGIPLNSAGQVCLATPVVVAAGILDLDNDENIDTLLFDSPGGGPDVTSDVDSINIDVDGDGIADIVIPK